jgi:hypothetical protein
MRTAAAIIMLTTLLGSGARAADQSYPTVFACEFANGQATSFANGAFTTKPPSPIQFVITDINLDTQSARAVTGAAGTMGQLRIIRALNANHFLEVLNEGFLSLTTIYDRDPTSGAYPAVQSRHSGVLGEPVFAQHTGLCRPQ